MSLTPRENALAILHYQDYDALPLVHFGFWGETLRKWKEEGYLTEEEASKWADGNEYDAMISKKLGFDFNWFKTVGNGFGLYPSFKREVVEELPDGSRKVRDGNGVIVLEKPGVVSIPSEIDHLLKDRESYERFYKERLQFSEERAPMSRFEPYRSIEGREQVIGLHCGSLYGEFRNWVGVEGSSYLYADDEDLYCEILNDVGELSYQLTKRALESGAKFDYAHFWEDICFKNGPLVIPEVFDEIVGPHYKRITDLVKSYGIDIISLDCDGCIDTLIPTWFHNGVNTMFPIEVGTWNASIKPWREKYGRELRGVGGMNKNVFSHGKEAVEAEIERLKPLIALGGYIPCPDHRIAPDAEFETVQYYCERMREEFCK